MNLDLKNLAQDAFSNIFFKHFKNYTSIKVL